MTSHFPLVAGKPPDVPRRALRLVSAGQLARHGLRSPCAATRSTSSRRRRIQGQTSDAPPVGEQTTGSLSGAMFIMLRADGDSIAGWISTSRRRRRSSSNSPALFSSVPRRRADPVLRFIWCRRAARRPVHREEVLRALVVGIYLRRNATPRARVTLPALRKAIGRARDRRASDGAPSGPTRAHADERSAQYRFEASLEGRRRALSRARGSLFHAAAGRARCRTTPCGTSVHRARGACGRARARSRSRHGARPSRLAGSQTLALFLAKTYLDAGRLDRGAVRGKRTPRTTASERNEVPDDQRGWRGGTRGVKRAAARHRLGSPVARTRTAEARKIATDGRWHVLGDPLDEHEHGQRRLHRSRRDGLSHGWPSLAGYDVMHRDAASARPSQWLYTSRVCSTPTRVDSGSGREHRLRVRRSMTTSRAVTVEHATNLTHGHQSQNNENEAENRVAISARFLRAFLIGALTSARFGQFGGEVEKQKNQKRQNCAAAARRICVRSTALRAKLLAVSERAAERMVNQIVPSPRVTNS